MRSRLMPFAVAVSAVVAFAGPSHAATFQTQYVGGGTAVVKQADEAPLADTGGVVCNVSTGTASIGGGCVSFGGGNAILVNDSVSGTAVAFQVCIDNDGDGLCTSPSFGPCGDDIFFSHSDSGAFFNPLGALPGSFRPGCPGGSWNGYVVLLCTGVHAAGSTHSHPAIEGTITAVGGGSGFGNFCGGQERNASSKAYVVI